VKFLSALSGPFNVRADSRYLGLPDIKFRARAPFMVIRYQFAAGRGDSGPLDA
jgi:hypothetical protein